MRSLYQQITNTCFVMFVVLGFSFTSAYPQSCDSPETETESVSTGRDSNSSANSNSNNSSDDDGRCRIYPEYCGGGSSAYVPPEYTFAEVLLAFRSIFSDHVSSDTPAVMLADSSPFNAKELNISLPKPPGQRVRLAALEEKQPLSIEETSALSPDMGVHTDPTRYVQLAALSGETAAHKYWQQLPRAIAAYANGFEARIKKSSEEQASDLYLIQVGAFSSDEAARAWCSDLLSVGVDCVVALP